MKASMYIHKVVQFIAITTLFTLDAHVQSCRTYSKRFNRHLEGVCVCDMVYCDSIDNAYLKLGDGEVSSYTTSKKGDRLKHHKLKVDTSKSRYEPDMILDPSVEYQEIIGFGGAFTDASAINIYKMPPHIQQLIMDAYFSSSGLQYTIGRIPIASCDFSTYVYSYNPVVGDLDMEHFSIDVDRVENGSHKLELIKRAIGMSKREIKMFSSPWAPPAWMTNENSTANCHVKGQPGDPYWKALALYYSKFISAYEAEGIPIWGMTVQNEPNDYVPLLDIFFTQFQSQRMTSEVERDFIKMDLGPMLALNHPNVKIIMMDDQKSNLGKWNAALEDPEARKYVHGIGLHWYTDLDFTFGGDGDFKKVNAFHEKYPEVFILGTEACEGYLRFPLSFIGTGGGVDILSSSTIWRRGRNYAKDILNDLANFASGWTDWNLVLDTNGGPNWADNFVDAPILIDEVGTQEFYKQPMYYVLGHFSKYITPGSVRVKINTTTSSNSKLKKVDVVAFKTPGKQYVVVILNDSHEDHTITIQNPSQGTIEVSLTSDSIQTLIWNV